MKGRKLPLPPAFFLLVTMILTDPDIRTAYARRLRVPQLELFLRQAIRAIRLRGDVSVLLTGDKQIRRWNRKFRGKNKPTDVLSFPSAPLDGPDGPIPAPIAGDLAISVETADRQAAEHGHTLAEEVRILLLHGTLHLAGYDHETDNGEMARLEQRLRVKLGLKSALIERTQSAPGRRSFKAVHKSSAERPAGKVKREAGVKIAARQPGREAVTRKTGDLPAEAQQRFKRSR